MTQYTIDEQKSRGGVWKVLGKILGLILIAFVLIMLPKWFGGSFSSLFSHEDEVVIDTTSYYAVFLANGQVYFGNMLDNNSLEIVLRNVYYIQSGSTPTSGINLVKLGTEIHGPESEMYINRSQVLFYEKLKADSKVVQSIESYKN